MNYLVDFTTTDGRYNGTVDVATTAWLVAVDVEVNTQASAIDVLVNARGGTVGTEVDTILPPRNGPY